MELVALDRVGGLAFNVSGYARRTDPGTDIFPRKTYDAIRARTGRDDLELLVDGSRAGVPVATSCNPVQAALGDFNHLRGGEGEMKFAGLTPRESPTALAALRRTAGEGSSCPVSPSIKCTACNRA